MEVKQHAGSDQLAENTGRSADGRNRADARRKRKGQKTTTGWVLAVTSKASVWGQDA